MKLLHRNFLFAKLLLSLLSLVVALMLVEVGHFTVRAVRGRMAGTDISLFDWCGDCPEVGFPSRKG